MDSLPPNPTGRFVPTLTTGAAWDELLGGLTRAEFSRRTGVPAESLARWARGGRPRRGSIAQIVVALGRPVAEVEALLERIVREGREKHAEMPEAAE